MDQCRQKCWIAGAVAGLAVWLMMSVLGHSSLLVGLLFGLIAMGLLGGLLVWGLCEGRGTAAENEALTATTWEPDPFTPSRRVVAAGGRVVSQRPLDRPAPEGLEASAPLERVTLHASRDPAVAQLVEPTPAEPQPAPPEPVTPPAETVALLATPSIASAIPVEPLTMATAGGAPQAGQPPARDLGPEVAPDRVGTITDLLPDEAPDTDLLPQDESPDTDPLLRIDGIDPMLANWLRQNGVTEPAQIAAWDDADIAKFAGMMGNTGHRIRSQDWVGQAARLARDAG